MAIVERNAFFVDGHIFATNKQAKEFERMAKRLEEFRKYFSAVDDRVGANLYQQMLGSAGGRENMRAWLKRLDEIGDELKIDLV